MEKQKLNTGVKKFINKKESVVSEALDGLCLFNPQLARIEGTQVITLRNINQNQVSIICGGGSGHEPAHSGFVNEKILSAAVCGGVFASPSTQEVLKAILHTSTPQGVLLLIKNYTGDVINFELAASFANSRGINIRTLHIADDIAFLEGIKDENELDMRKNEARGLAGTVLLYKLLGAASWMGRSLDYLYELGQKILANTYTLGTSMSSCSIPGFPSTFQLADDELEIGLGIHGEKGKGRDKLMTCDELVEKMLQKFDQFLLQHQAQNNCTKVIILLNNLGATTDIEMSIFARAVYLRLQNQNKNLTILRAVQGRLMTSLEMHGISLTIMTVQPIYESELLSYIDLETNSQNWKTLKTVNNIKEIYVPASILCQQLEQDKKQANQLIDPKNYQNDQCALKLMQMFKKIMEVLQKKEDYFNQLDSEVGDGDTGSGVSRSCQTVLAELEKLPWNSQYKACIVSVGEIIANSFGGTSGPLYGIFLSNAAAQLQQLSSNNSYQDYLNALKSGISGIEKLGKARVGDRTMLDVLHYVQQGFQEQIQQQQEISKKALIQKLLEIAKISAEKVKQLKAKKGRARYLGGQEIGKKDPGCELIVEWLTVLNDNIE